ncbi:MAG: thiamine phosphate synthase [Candidatus Omnitrophica bacterium]|nr:thiamine phosphate synthase [Candidatus Omnitrophota bacterium]
MPVKKELKRGSLYVITDPGAQRGKGHLEVLTQALEGGASVVQLRDKEAKDEALITVGRALREVCDQFGALLIVNERVDVAKAVGADGLHIGQDDLSLKRARQEIGGNRLLGVSTHSLEQARRAFQEGADYIGVGPIFKTPTKPDYAPVGLEFIHEVRKNLSIPFIAIGGINLSNIEEVLGAGAYAIAVVRAVVAQEDIRGATARLKSLMDARKEEAGKVYE